MGGSASSAALVNITVLGSPSHGPVVVRPTLQLAWLPVWASSVMQRSWPREGGTGDPRLACDACSGTWRPGPCR